MTPVNCLRALMGVSDGRRGSAVPNRASWLLRQERQIRGRQDKLLAGAMTGMGGERSSNRFTSILFEAPEESAHLDRVSEPEYFADLNLDQVVESITANREEYDLKPLFYERLGTIDGARYRHEVFGDLDHKALSGLIGSFAQSMRHMREHLVQVEKLRHRYQKEGWFLDAVEIYCGAVGDLAHGLGHVEMSSRGLLGFREYLAEYVDSPAFITLLAETEEQKENLSKVDYCVHIKGSRVSVRKYDAETDYSADVLTTFEKFKQGAVNDYRVGFRSRPEMNHVEERILDLVALLFSESFSALDGYCARQRSFLDGTIRRFDREVQFYVAYLEYIEQFETTGLSFCYPVVSRRSKEVLADDTFDLALANKLVPQGSAVVCNDFSLMDPERIFVVSGPNQGGKTTFARTFGQLHHLAGIGLPVPGRRAQLFWFDKLFTHFEREEDLTNLSGKLEDDLVRIQHILNEATANSIIIMNEIFTSTTLDDAVFLGTRVIEAIIQLDLLAVYVTFVEELASFSGSTVSMVTTIVPENPAQRTYKVVRKPADGLSYAVAIAEKYGLTYEQLKGRVGG